MVFCLTVGCANKSGLDKGLHFCRVPSMVKERRSRWISAFSRDDFAKIRPCSDNLVYARCEVFRTFLFVFMIVFRVIVLP